MRLDALASFLPWNGGSQTLVGGAGVDVVIGDIIDLLGVGVGVAPPNIIGNVTLFGTDFGIGEGFCVNGTQVRPGIAETMSSLRTAVEAGFMTRNEAREELDLMPLPGLDAPIVAMNMGTGGGQTNLGTDTSGEAGTPNDFTS